MENLDYLDAKSQSKQNKNLDVLPVFFTDEELDTLSKKSISIVGTNGKTSTANHIFQYLQDIDVNPCRFTSPHLIKVNERIQSNNGFIWDRDIDKYLNEIRKFEAKEKVVLGYFETLFLISCKYFLDMNLDIFIVEAGIGGRLDTTSIINSENVALTNIGYDHTEILGETLEEILIEKIKISNRVKNFFVGDVSVKSKNLVSTTYNSMMKAISIIKNGIHLGDIGEAIQTYVEKKGFSVVKDFCGHGIGKIFHEPPNILHYGKKGDGIKLETGMIFTVEPMINEGIYNTKLLKDGWTAVTKDKSLSAQFEHTVGVTKNGFEIFTKSKKQYDKPPYLI